MPTVLRIGPYRFFFYASDRPEPPHVHVERETKCAKVWLTSVHPADAGSFSHTELARIIRLVREHHDDLVRSWHDFFND